jgi:hypothetical protein
VRERERKKAKTLNDGDTPGSTGNLEVNCSGRAGLKEGAVVVVGEWSPQEEEPNHKKTVQAQPSEKKRNGDAPLGYLGQTALKWEQCNMDGQSVARRPGKHSVPKLHNRTVLCILFLSNSTVNMGI